MHSSKDDGLGYSSPEELTSRTGDADEDIFDVPVLRIRKTNHHDFITVPSTTSSVNERPGELELELGHLPNIQRYWRGEPGWSHRRCIPAYIANHPNDRDPPEVPAHVNGTYIIMICTSPELGRNTAVARFRNPGVYGDAFIFRVSEDYVDHKGRAIFETLPAEMISLGIARRLVEEIARGWMGGIVPRDWVNLNEADRHQRVLERIGWDDETLRENAGSPN